MKAPPDQLPSFLDDVCPSADTLPPGDPPPDVDCDAVAGEPAETVMVVPPDEVSAGRRARRPARRPGRPRVPVDIDRVTALLAAGRTKTAAAQQMGIGRRTLYRALAASNRVPQSQEGVLPAADEPAHAAAGTEQPPAPTTKVLRSDQRQRGHAPVPPEGGRDQKG
ncbi:MAG: helix-turn-helix domain-containing protein [Acidobacteria bacterium]|nr:helix-turn-helix domain-containing protein [Acidobacteriota bacterium]